MKIRKILLNLLLFFISASFSLLGISLFLEIIQKSEKTTQRQLQIKKIEQKRQLEVDYPAKIKSVKNGLFQFIS